MGDVITLRLPGEQWASGPMRCLRCRHDFVAARKLPEDAVVDCPECGCHTAVAAGIYCAGPADAVWACSCGNTLMELVASADGYERLFCIGCGTEKPVKS